MTGGGGDDTSDGRSVTTTEPRLGCARMMRSGTVWPRENRVPRSTPVGSPSMALLPGQKPMMPLAKRTRMIWRRGRPSIPGAPSEM